MKIGHDNAVGEYGRPEPMKLQRRRRAVCSWEAQDNMRCQSSDELDFGDQTSGYRPR